MKAGFRNQAQCSWIKPRNGCNGIVKLTLVPIPMFADMRGFPVDDRNMFPPNIWHYTFSNPSFICSHLVLCSAQIFERAQISLPLGKSLWSATFILPSSLEADGGPNCRRMHTLS
jgi:hypothetical protein